MQEKNRKLKVFFSGISGIGMSALAILAKKFGYDVEGSDLNINNEYLLKEGIKIKHHHEANIDKELIFFIHSSAIKKNHTEMKKATEYKIPIISRGAFLYQLSEKFEKKIMITGMSGKTTTTAIAAFLFDKLNQNPTIICGGILNNYNSNFKFDDKLKLLIAESDESDGTFINAKCDFGIITNITRDHMDFFKSEEGLMTYFNIFAQNSEKILISGDCLLCKKLIVKLKKNHFITYGLSSNNDFYPLNIKKNSEGLTFDLYYQKKLLLDGLFLKMQGEFNVLNATASIALFFLYSEKINDLKTLNEIKSSLALFSGIQKRFSFLGEIINKNLVFDDYAHSAPKIKACIDSAKHFIEDKNMSILFCIELHRYSRIKDSFHEFAKNLDKNLQYALLPIYSGFEENEENINENALIEILKNNYEIKIFLILNSLELQNYILKNNIFNTLIVFSGAGKSSFYAKELIELNKKYDKR